MCARFTIRKAKAAAEALRAEIIDVDLSQPRYNVAPTQNIAVCLVRKQQRVLMDVRWGLIPSWAKDPAIGHKLINARAETLAEKPSFRKAFRAQRCLIPADGFYEWQVVGKGKQPMYIQVEDGEIFTFAGLYEIWQPPGEEPLWTCTIVTTNPNELMKPIHNRMPVILPQDFYDAWLDPDLADVAELQKMLQPFDAVKMNVYPVSPHVNKPANDDELCIAPL